MDATIHRHVLHYREQESGQTLAEGLAEYYAVNAGIIARPADLPPDSAALFRSHDMCHVIFGLDTTLEDEAMADTRTMLSCDVGAARYARYFAVDKQTQKIFKQIGISGIVSGTMKALPRMARAMAEAWRMKKKWPWVPPESYLSRPLGELRREFGIRVI